MKFFLNVLFFSFSFIFHLNALPTSLNKNPSNPPLERKFLITGCACSGTLYITHLLNKCGLEMGHEVIEKDGFVAWQGAVDVNYGSWGWRLPSKKVEFEVILHQVRDPIPVITSLYNCCAPILGKEWGRFWKYVCYYVPQINLDEPLVVRCAKYWYYWNLLAEQRAEWTYRIEDIDHVIDEMENRMMVKLDREVLENLSKTTHHHKRKTSFRASWDLLKKELDPELFENIKSLALRYGYSVPN